MGNIYVSRKWDRKRGWVVQAAPAPEGGGVPHSPKPPKIEGEKLNRFSEFLRTSAGPQKAGCDRW